MPMNKVIKFINRFTQNGQNNGTIETFTCGCCYWFAKILFSRFMHECEVEMMYDQIENHFGCLIDGVVYDITGDVTAKYDWQTFSSVFETDELLGSRLIRDCIEF